mmetsp:Transcript_35052/g.58949  ORF Transcript_35052/g.58949 Transcript_35052/m.58949 type:complete len:897 (-) Transcript_35052:6646-9336(-)
MPEPVVEAVVRLHGRVAKVHAKAERGPVDGEQPNAHEPGAGLGARGLEPELDAGVVCRELRVRSEPHRIINTVKHHGVPGRARGGQHAGHGMHRLQRQRHGRDMVLVQCVAVEVRHSARHAVGGGSLSVACLPVEAPESHQIGGNGGVPGDPQARLALLHLGLRERPRPDAHSTDLAIEALASLWPESHHGGLAHGVRGHSEGPSPSDEFAINEDVAPGVFAFVLNHVHRSNVVPALGLKRRVPQGRLQLIRPGHLDGERHPHKFGVHVEGSDGGGHDGGDSGGKAVEAHPRIQGEGAREVQRLGGVHDHWLRAVSSELECVVAVHKHVHRGLLSGQRLSVGLWVGLVDSDEPECGQREALGVRRRDIHYLAGGVRHHCRRGLERSHAICLVQDADRRQRGHHVGEVHGLDIRGGGRRAVELDLGGLLHLQHKRVRGQARGVAERGDAQHNLEGGGGRRGQRQRHRGVGEGGVVLELRATLTDVRAVPVGGGREDHSIAVHQPGRDPNLSALGPVSPHLVEGAVCRDRHHRERQLVGGGVHGDGHEVDHLFGVLVYHLHTRVLIVVDGADQGGGNAGGAGHAVLANLAVGALARVHQHVADGLVEVEHGHAFANLHLVDGAIEEAPIQSHKGRAQQDVVVVARHWERLLRRRCQRLHVHEKHSRTDARGHCDNVVPGPVVERLERRQGEFAHFHGQPGDFVPLNGERPHLKQSHGAVVRCRRLKVHGHHVAVGEVVSLCRAQRGHRVLGGAVKLQRQAGRERHRGLGGIGQAVVRGHQVHLARRRHHVTVRRDVLKGVRLALRVQHRDVVKRQVVHAACGEGLVGVRVNAARRAHPVEVRVQEPVLGQGGDGECAVEPLTVETPGAESDGHRLSGLEVHLGRIHRQKRGGLVLGRH